MFYANSYQREQSYYNCILTFIHFVLFNFFILRIFTLNLFISFHEVRKEINFIFIFFMQTTLLKQYYLPQFSSSFHRPYVDGKYRFVMQTSIVMLMFLLQQTMILFFSSKGGFCNYYQQFRDFLLYLINHSFSFYNFLYFFLILLKKHVSRIIIGWQVSHFSCSSLIAKLSMILF